MRGVCLAGPLIGAPRVDGGAPRERSVPRWRRAESDTKRTPGCHAKVGSDAYPCHARDVGYCLGASNRMTNPSAQIMVLARSHINIADRVPLFGYREST